LVGASGWLAACCRLVTSSDANASAPSVVVALAPPVAAAPLDDEPESNPSRVDDEGTLVMVTMWPPS
jgi:hypothetical protein